MLGTHFFLILIHLHESLHNFDKTFMPISKIYFGFFLLLLVIKASKKDNVCTFNEFLLPKV
jgi:hypothetical protein